MRIHRILRCAAGLALLSAVGIAVSGLGQHDFARGKIESVSDNPDGSVQPGRISSLSVIEGVIQVRYPNISHISPEQLIEMQNGSNRLVLLDVREADEYSISRLNGAIRVSPDAAANDVQAVAGDLKDRVVVVYCSVGARSSILAGRVQKALRDAGAVAVHNLSGGIFRWHNEERALVDAEGETALVHPYDSYWGQLVRRQELVASSRPTHAPRTN